VSADRSGLERLQYAFVFFVVTLVAAAVGLGGLTADAAEIAKALFFVFLIVATVMLVLGLIGGREE
jgi:uncharacterized membrane protein YtjA (UPF0391 family)